MHTIEDQNERLRIIGMNIRGVEAMMKEELDGYMKYQATEPNSTNRRERYPRHKERMESLAKRRYDLMQKSQAIYKSIKAAPKEDHIRHVSKKVVDKEDQEER